ncbi:MAG: N-formylglutamate amidohydrolase [Rhizobiaceae bacterium]|nr:N-formylglutamate amidohydrolase [Rhizobiaceae bacterium]
MEIVEAGQVRITNRTGSSPYVFVCDHASNWLPPGYGTLGLPASDMSRHIAWDPGALPVASKLSGLLDAALVQAGVSRLAIDCNRPLDAPDLIPPVSETTTIPGNNAVSDKEREQRIALSWRPFHDAIDDVIGERLAAGRDTRLISIHSFNPVYKGVSRPWEIGILHDDDERLSAPLIAALSRQGTFTIGDNQPYSPADRVYFTLERHARSRGMPCAMIEIRNDEIAGETGQQAWAERLANILSGIDVQGIVRETGMTIKPKGNQTRA